MPNPPAPVLSAAQIGRCGELLVQYSLLTRGIESAPLSTDTGVDLVAYAPGNAQAFTIQVKANLQSKAAGGKGKAALDWWLPQEMPAQMAALVDLSSLKIWLFLKAELAALAQQKSSGRLHFYMFTDPTHKPRSSEHLVHAHAFERYLIQNRAHELFGI